MRLKLKNQNLIHVCVSGTIDNHQHLHHLHKHEHQCHQNNQIYQNHHIHHNTFPISVSGTITGISIISVNINTSSFFLAFCMLCLVFMLLSRRSYYAFHGNHRQVAADPFIFCILCIPFIPSIQLLEYVIPPAAAAAPATATAPPKSPLCYGVSHVMVLAMLWC